MVEMRPVRKKKIEAAVVLVTCIHRQDFQICGAVRALGFGGSKPTVMLSLRLFTSHLFI